MSLLREYVNMTDEQRETLIADLEEKNDEGMKRIRNPRSDIGQKHRGGKTPQDHLIQDLTAKRIRAAMKAAHVTTSELALMAGVSIATIFNATSGKKRVKPMTRARIAFALQVDSDWLTGREPSGQFEELFEEMPWAVCDQATHLHPNSVPVFAPPLMPAQKIAMIEVIARRFGGMTDQEKREVDEKAMEAAGPLPTLPQSNPITIINLNHPTPKWADRIWFAERAAERMLALLEVTGTPKTHMAAFLGISDPAFFNVCKGKSILRDTLCLKLVTKYGIPFDWFKGKTLSGPVHLHRKKWDPNFK